MTLETVKALKNRVCEFPRAHPFIREVVKEGIDVIGMLKDNKQNYFYKGRLYNLKQLSILVNFSTPGNFFGSVCVKTGKHGIPVKLVFVRNRNKKSEYIIILTTDCSLPDRISN